VSIAGAPEILHRAPGKLDLPQRRKAGLTLRAGADSHRGLFRVPAVSGMDTKLSGAAVAATGKAEVTARPLPVEGVRTR
jgi:hypothetical protein